MSDVNKELEKLAEIFSVPGAEEFAAADQEEVVAMLEKRAAIADELVKLAEEEGIKDVLDQWAAEVGPEGIAQLLDELAAEQEGAEGVEVEETEGVEKQANFEKLAEHVILSTAQAKQELDEIVGALEKVAYTQIDVDPAQLKQLLREGAAAATKVAPGSINPEDLLPSFAKMKAATASELKPSVVRALKEALAQNKVPVAGLGGAAGGLGLAAILQRIQSRKKAKGLRRVLSRLLRK